MSNLSRNSWKEILGLKLKSSRSLKFSLRLRFYVLFAFIAVTMLSIVYSASLARGLLDFGYSKRNSVFAGEIENIASAMEKRFGTISSIALQMGTRLERNTENFLKNRNLPINELRLNSETLKDLLVSQFDQLMFSLAQSQTSGVFIILNATSSARMREAMFSRAGLYVINWEPDLIIDGTQQFQLLRGPADIALKQELVMEKNWAMEFNIEEAVYYTAPQKYAAAYPAFARRLSLWTPRTVIRGATYSAMLCSVPLMDSEGNVFGICGFDVSEQYFREIFSPSINNFGSIFCALAPLEEGGLDLSHAMISWRRLVDEKPATAKVLSVTGAEDGFSVYTSNTGEKYVGLQKILKLHHPDLPFDVQEFALALLIPQEEYRSARFERRIVVTGIFALIFIICVSASYLVNRWFVRPMMSVIDAMREDTEDETKASADVDITDFEALLASIRERAEDNRGFKETKRVNVGEKEEASPPDAESKREFAEKVKTLSAAEKKVFDLYIEDYTGPEISQTLMISPNTVKTHTRNIMAKMRLTSKRELISANIKILRGENHGEGK